MKKFMLLCVVAVSLTACGAGSTPTVADLNINCPGEEWTCELVNEQAYEMVMNDFPVARVDVWGPVMNQDAVPAPATSASEAMELQKANYSGYGMAEMNVFEENDSSSFFETTGQTYYMTTIEKDGVYFTCTAYVNSDYVDQIEADLREICDGVN